MSTRMSTHESTTAPPPPAPAAPPEPPRPPAPAAGVAAPTPVTAAGAPALSSSPDAQRREALARANAVRSARASLKRRIQKGELVVTDVVGDSPEEASSMPVAELLAAQHRWGAARARRLLARVPISETRAIGTLTDRERRAIVALLED